MGHRILNVTLVLLFFLSIVTLAISADNETTTPYGDYCKDCSTYGTCKKVLPPEKAVNSLKQYYKARGYRVGTVSHKGRFIEAVIYKNKKPVDKILLDRKTGRLRSMY